MNSILTALEITMPPDVPVTWTPHVGEPVPGTLAIVDNTTVNAAITTNPPASRTALELGTAALADAPDFATAAQGAKADTAAQPADLALKFDKAGGTISEPVQISSGATPGARDVLSMTNPGATSAPNFSSTWTWAVGQPGTYDGRLSLYANDGISSASQPVMSVMAGPYAVVETKAISSLSYQAFVTGRGNSQMIKARADGGDFNMTYIYNQEYPNGSTNAEHVIGPLVGTFKIRNDSNAVFFTVDAATGRTTFAGPIKPGAYTVATLPSASTSGAGSICYASNARKSGEGVGAGSGIPVWSDGTNWRTYYDNTVAVP